MKNKKKIVNCTSCGTETINYLEKEDEKICYLCSEVLMYRTVLGWHNL